MISSMGGFGCGCGCCRAHAKHAPGRKFLVVCLGAVALCVIVVIAVVADEPDIDGAQEGEDRGLNETDEHLHEIKDGDEEGPVQKIFAAEDVAEKTDGKSERAN